MLNFSIDMAKSGAKPDDEQFPSIRVMAIALAPDSEMT